MRCCAQVRKIADLTNDPADLARQFAAQSSNVTYGRTFVDKGLNLASSMLASLDPTARKRVLIFTDGLPSSMGSAEKAFLAAKAAGVIVQVVLIGSEVSFFELPATWTSMPPLKVSDGYAVLPVILAQIVGTVACDSATESPTATFAPSGAPTFEPTASPSQAPTSYPTFVPSQAPSDAPTAPPTQRPTGVPTTKPPTTDDPSFAPSHTPTFVPTTNPSAAPSEVPSETPTATPTLTPTLVPSFSPTIEPTPTPSEAPTSTPTQRPTGVPTTKPPTTDDPSFAPSHTPTDGPSAEPSATPTDFPTDSPSEDPTVAPTFAPSQQPTATPSSSTPSASPTSAPSAAPSAQPTFAPTLVPTAAPSAASTSAPSTATPTAKPSNVPTAAPTNSPTDTPTRTPTRDPTDTPTRTPTWDYSVRRPMCSKYDGNTCSLCGSSAIDKAKGCDATFCYGSALSASGAPGSRNATKAKEWCNRRNTEGCGCQWTSTSTPWTQYEQTSQNTNKADYGYCCYTSCTSTGNQGAQCCGGCGPTSAPTPQPTAAPTSAPTTSAPTSSPTFAPTKALPETLICFSQGDPHIMDFLGGRFDLHTPGTYSVLSLGSIQVQASVKGCGVIPAVKTDGEVGCNYELGVRLDGSNVFTIGKWDAPDPKLNGQSMGTRSTTWSKSIRISGTDLRVWQTASTLDINSVAEIENDDMKIRLDSFDSKDLAYNAAHLETRYRRGFTITIKNRDGFPKAMGQMPGLCGGGGESQYRPLGTDARPSLSTSTSLVQATASAPTTPDPQLFHMTKAVGSWDGDECQTEIQCPKGSYISRWRIRNSTVLDSIQGQCSDGTWLKQCGGKGGTEWNGTLGTNSIDVRFGALIDNFGGRGGAGGAKTTLACAGDGYWIAGYQVRNTTTVARLELRCVWMYQSAEIGAKTGTEVKATCPLGTSISKWKIRYGQFVNSIQGQCGDPAATWLPRVGNEIGTEYYGPLGSTEIAVASGGWIDNFGGKGGTGGTTRSTLSCNGRFNGYKAYSEGKLLNGAQLMCNSPAPPIDTSGKLAQCSDIPPTASSTCAAEKAAGRCSESWMSGYCCRSCFGCQCSAGKSYPCRTCAGSYPFVSCTCEEWQVAKGTSFLTEYVPHAPDAHWNVPTLLELETSVASNGDGHNRMTEANARCLRSFRRLGFTDAANSNAELRQLLNDMAGDCAIDTLGIGKAPGLRAQWERSFCEAIQAKVDDANPSPVRRRVARPLLVAPVRRLCLYPLPIRFP
jgi:hypothetical protein